MIAIVYPQFYGIGGIARYLDSFLRNLPESHPPIYLITGDANKIPREYPGVNIIHIPVDSNRLNLFVWGIKVRQLLIKLHQENRINVVNFHFPPLIPGLFLPKRIPVVLTAHTTYLGMSGNFYSSRHFDSPWKGTSLAIKSWMEHRIFNLTHRVITLTEQGKQEVLAYGFKGPIDIIPNGADLSQFNPDKTITKNIDVLFSGRIELRKGSRAMAEICKLLVSNKPDIRICIVGYGDDDAWVNTALEGLSDNIHITGKVPFSDMIDYYNRSHIYVSTSYYEGLPGTCLEAMAMHLPAVVWDFLFYQNLVIEGQTGILVKPNDFSSMCSKVLALLENPELIKQMGENSRKVLEDEFNWHKLSENILKVFQQ